MIEIDKEISEIESRIAKITDHLECARKWNTEDCVSAYSAAGCAYWSSIELTAELDTLRRKLHKHYGGII